MNARTVIALTALLSLLWGTPEPLPAQSGWEANLHGATLLNDLFEEGGNGLQAGARLLYTTPWRVTLGGNFDWARLDEVGPGFAEGATADLLMYSAEVGYAAPVSPRADLLLAAGIGAVTVRLRDETSPAGTLTSTGQLIPVGLGVRVRNREQGATWAIRADVRDDIILLDVRDPLSGEVDQEPRHNLELSAGVSFLFGGVATEPAVRAPEPRPVEPMVEEADRVPPPAAGIQGDADRDGVPDRLDRCPRTPAILAVGATGCPIDVDRDGTPDRRTPQVPPGRPAAAAVPEEAPVEEPAVEEPRVEEPRAAEPLAEEPPPAPAAEVPSDTDRDGVPDLDDRCMNTPPGAPVDERGCPAPPVIEPEGEEGEAPPEEPAEERPGEPADEAPEEEAEALPGVCLDGRPWDRPGITIAFDGRLWVQLGQPEPITRDNLKQVGEFDGVPIYVATVAAEPYMDIWIPRCSGAYQLYVEQGVEE